LTDSKKCLSFEDDLKKRNKEDKVLKKKVVKILKKTYLKGKPDLVLPER